MIDYNISGETLNRLWFLQTQKCDYFLFQKIFGNTAEHCWRKFAMHNAINFLDLWNYCLQDEKTKLLNYLNSSEFENEYHERME